MVTSTNATSFPNSSSFFVTNPDSTKGFISALACVTQDGYGYNGRIAQKCDKGTFNAQDTRSTCTACAYGLTTSDVGTGITVADCGLAPGFGYVNNTGTGNSSVSPCPIGFYNNNTWNRNTSDLCIACPTGFTTLKEGSDSPEQCNRECRAAVTVSVTWHIRCGPLAKGLGLCWLTMAALWVFSSLAGMRQCWRKNIGQHVLLPATHNCWWSTIRNTQRNPPHPAIACLTLSYTALHCLLLLPLQCARPVTEAPPVQHSAVVLLVQT
jgi:hypothetical protein